MSGQVPILTGSGISQKIQKPMQSQHKTLRSKCIYMQRSKGMANCPYITGPKTSTSKITMHSSMSNVTEPGGDLLSRRGIAETSRPPLKNVRIETEQVNDWDCSDLEEGISRVAKTTKRSVIGSGLSGRRTHDTDNLVEETKSLSGIDSVLIRGLRKNGVECRKIIGNCKCKKDHFLPCCSRAAKWIRVLFNKSGKRFYYKNCKTQYEVRVIVKNRKY